MQVIYFSLQGCKDLTKLPIDEGTKYSVYSQFNKDLNHWELILQK